MPFSPVGHSSSHRLLEITERVRLEGSTVGHQVTTEHRIVSRWFMIILSEGDSTASLGSLFQCMVTCTLKKFFIFGGNFCASVAACCLLSYCLAPPRRAWILLLDTHFWVLMDTDKIKPQVIVASAKHQVETIFHLCRTRTWSSRWYITVKSLGGNLSFLPFVL